jgi:hypothetical protein
LSIHLTLILSNTLLNNLIIIRNILRKKSQMKYIKIEVIK